MCGEPVCFILHWGKSETHIFNGPYSPATWKIQSSEVQNSVGLLLSFLWESSPAVAMTKASEMTSSSFFDGEAGRMKVHHLAFQTVALSGLVQSSRHTGAKQWPWADVMLSNPPPLTCQRTIYSIVRPPTVVFRQWSSPVCTPLPCCREHHSSPV